jgi:uncharacterized protein YndB with AHSA1/START domain
MTGEIIAAGDHYQVRFERLLRKPIEKVFAALTVPERLAAWIGAAQIEARLGGRFTLVFADPPYRMEGAVSAYEPPSLFESTWPGDPGATPSLVRFALSPEGQTTRLVLTHTFIAKADAPNVAAGWHEHLERLGLAADGLTTTRWDRDREAALAAVYLTKIA